MCYANTIMFVDMSMVNELYRKREILPYLIRISLDSNYVCYYDVGFDLSYMEGFDARRWGLAYTVKY